jgi:WD40 repeat protein
MATAEQQGRVTVWDVDRRAPASELTLPVVGKAGNVSAVAYSPDGTVLAADLGTTVRLWDVRVPDRPRLLARA